jgi:hypothetical protein
LNNFDSFSRRKTRGFCIFLLMMMIHSCPIQIRSSRLISKQQDISFSSSLVVVAFVVKKQQQQQQTLFDSVFILHSTFFPTLLLPTYSLPKKTNKRPFVFCWTSSAKEQQHTTHTHTHTDTHLHLYHST